MAKDSKSYGLILKSSSVVGGAQAITMLIGIVQTKFVAIFLGPIGVGLAGTFGSVIGITGRLAGLGVAGSAVRQIAEANASNDREKLGKTVTTLRWLCWCTGLLGAVALAVFAKPVSQLTFGTDQYWWAIVILSVVVLIRRIQNGQMAYIQGLRRIGDLAKLKIIGALAGLTVGVGLYAWLGLRGIVPAIVALAAVDLVFSWYYARRANTPVCKVSRKEFFDLSGDFVKLGVVLMWAGLLSAIVAFTTRAMIINKLDLHAAGIYQSAFRISGMFVGFILAAMSADFYPRLTGIAQDNQKIRQLVNEQTEIGLLLAVPGLLATITLAPWIISILYTPEFTMSGELLKWFVLGCLGRVISWPMGIILLGKGCKGWLFSLETTASALHVGLIWIGLNHFGIIGVSYAFALLYVFHILAVMLISYRVCDFRWSREVVMMLCMFIPVTAAVIVGSLLMEVLLATMVGGVLTLIVGLYCMNQLSSRLEKDHKINRVIGKIPWVKRLAAK
ncbi:O-antigen translocase [Akkermansiaceae bacterium]|nr:O-antigen translocase [Akkermansiaceae bacterium]